MKKKPDVSKSKYASFLERLISRIMEMEPDKIGVCFEGKSGDVCTTYYGDLYPSDKAMMSWHFQSDAMMDTVLVNAKLIISEADDGGDDDDDDDDGEDDEDEQK